MKVFESVKMGRTMSGIPYTQITKGKGQRVLCLLLLPAVIGLLIFYTLHRPDSSIIMTRNDEDDTALAPGRLQRSLYDIATELRGLRIIISTDKSRMAPSSSLAYEVDTPARWKKRLEHRNRQSSLSNNVVDTTLPLKEFFQTFWEPTFSCTFPVRVGKYGDGGKWICNPEELLFESKRRGQKVLIYSLGSNSEYSFETGLNQIFTQEHAEIHTFDMGVPKIKPPSFINFHQVKLAGELQEDEPTPLENILMKQKAEELTAVDVDTEGLSPELIPVGSQPKDQKISPFGNTIPQPSQKQRKSQGGFYKRNTRQDKTTVDMEQEAPKKSLSTIRKVLRHQGRPIDILKVDIEGSEYDVLKTYMTHEDGCLLQANIVLMESHWDTASNYNDLFRRLTDICGMELYMKEPNIQYSSGEVIEWCFVKVDWLTMPKEF